MGMLNITGYYAHSKVIRGIGRRECGQSVAQKYFLMVDGLERLRQSYAVCERT